MMRLVMSSSRQVSLDRRVLAKLMLLEYFRPEFFKLLAASQAQYEGHWPDLERAEQVAQGEPAASSKAEAKVAAASAKAKPATSRKGDLSAKGEEDGQGTTGSQGPDLNPEMAAWLDDKWLRGWLAMEPPVGNVDLRPYFYFSRDSLGPLSEVARRLSPAAQEVLRGLLQEGKVMRQSALKQAEGLNAADAAAIFEDLTARIRREDDASVRDRLLSVVFELVGAQKEMAAQIVLFLQGLPDSSIPPSVVPKLQLACEGTDAIKAAVLLIRKWASESANPVLKQAAQTAVKKLQ
jgi:hypothetical protein